jgi:hypothetical protein
MQTAEKNNNIADTDLNVRLGFYEWKRENIRKAREKRIQEVRSTLPTLFETSGHSKWAVKPGHRDRNLIPRLHLGAVSRENLDMTVRSFHDSPELKFPVKLRKHSNSHIDWDFNIENKDRLQMAENSKGMVSDVDFQRYRIELLKAEQRRKIKMYQRPPSTLSLLTNHSSLVLGPNRHWGQSSQGSISRLRGNNSEQLRRSKNATTDWLNPKHNLSYSHH